VRAENPAALRFILQDDIYLLPNDKAAIKATPAADVPEAIAIPVVETPIVPIVTETPVPVVSTPSITSTETEAPAYNYQGDNKKAYLILTHYVNEDFIAANHLTALQNILQRLGYGLADIAIFNIVTKPAVSIIDLVNYFKPQKLLILGQNAVPAGMALPPLNQPKKMKNGVLLHSFSFDEMMDSTDKKKAFWEQIKNL
jgi:hypothetical protein